MDPSVIVAVLALLSSLGGIVIANRFTARTARQAQETSAEIERKKLDASSWQEAVALWKDDVKQLRERLVEDDLRHELETTKLQGRIDTMEEELRLVNRDRAFDRIRIDALVAWSRHAVTVMRNAGITFPNPPPGVEESLPPSGPGAIRPII
jgi:hypothetical protein